MVENGVDEISDEVKELDVRWDELKRFVEDKENEISEAQDTLENVSEELKPVEGLLSKIDEIFSKPMLFGDNVDKGRELLDQLKVCSLLFIVHTVINNPSPSTSSHLILTANIVDLNLLGPYCKCLHEPIPKF